MSIPEIFPKLANKERLNYLRKSEWDVYYSCKNRYPYLVVENLHPTILHQQQQINRQDIEDPFRPDPKIPPSCQLTLPIYDNLKRYGLSPGHNAPAGTHRSSLNVWSETFMFSNMTPQEITFNAGVWVILENWVKRLIRHPKLTRLRCITGSTPAGSGNKARRRVWDPSANRMTTVNVPSHMFKIIVSEDRREFQANVGKISDTAPLYVACFLYPNTSVIPTPKTWDLAKYRVMIDDIERLTGYSIYALIGRYYKSNPIGRIESLEKVASIDFQPNDGLLIQMERAKYYYRLAYGKSRREIDKVWNELLKNAERLQISDLSHHEMYRNARLSVLNNSSQKHGYTSSSSSASTLSLDKSEPKSQTKTQKSKLQTKTKKPKVQNKTQTKTKTKKHKHIK